MIASDVMTRDILSARPDATIAQAIRTMLDNRISGLPAVGWSGF
jgi:CBS domain-containing protein